jgi:hypothetical protein
VVSLLSNGSLLSNSRSPPNRTAPLCEHPCRTPHAPPLLLLRTAIHPSPALAPSSFNKLPTRCNINSLFLTLNIRINSTTILIHKWTSSSVSLHTHLSPYNVKSRTRPRIHPQLHLLMASDPDTFHHPDLSTEEEYRPLKDIDQVRQRDRSSRVQRYLCLQVNGLLRKSRFCTSLSPPLRDTGYLPKLTI